MHMYVIALLQLGNRLRTLASASTVQGDVLVRQGVTLNFSRPDPVTDKECANLSSRSKPGLSTRLSE